MDSNDWSYTVMRVNGRLHTDVFCPKCGDEMTELEFDTKNGGNRFIWECFRKCPKCGAKVEWRAIR